MIIKGIQIIGTQRSGSNLLRLMLNQFAEVSAPHPPHLLQNFTPLLPLYGDLSKVDNFRTLINDVCEFIELNPVKWRKVRLNREIILTGCENNTLIDIFKGVYEEKARTFNASYWCCKSMSNVYFLDELEETLKPFYIYLYRDGRDVALSFKKAIVGEKHPFFLAKVWENEQRLSLDHVTRIGSDRAIMISYEELIKEPRDVFKRLCSLISVPFNEKFLKYYKSEESKVTAEAGVMWSNLVKPIMSENFNKFKNGLSDEDVVIFESVAGEMLEKLGYKLELPNLRTKEFSSSTIENFQRINIAMKKKVLESSNREDLDKRIPQMRLIERIKSRRKAISLD